MKLSEFYKEYCIINGNKPKLTDHMISFFDDEEYRDNYIFMQTIKTRRSPTSNLRSMKTSEEIRTYYDLIQEYIKTIHTQ